RAAFVTKTTNVTFVDGVPSDLHDEKPSELLAIVSAPRDVFDAFITSLSQIIALRVDLSGQEAALANQKVATIEAERALREKQLERSPAPESANRAGPLLEGTSSGRVRRAPLAMDGSPGADGGGVGRAGGAGGGDGAGGGGGAVAGGANGGGNPFERSGVL